MNKNLSFAILAMSALTALSLWGCTPEIGSDQWCTNLKEKPKADWSMNEATDFAKYCIIK